MSLPFNLGFPRLRMLRERLRSAPQIPHVERSRNERSRNIIWASTSLSLQIPRVERSRNERSRNATIRVFSWVEVS